MMKFSIIIPVYNVERYLEQCVRSVLEQTFGEFEVILVDDGSTDSSGALCDAYAAQDVRVRALHQQNAGSSAARNAGIAYAAGDYIMFLDGDDFWLEASLLERVSSTLQQHPVDVIEFDAIKFIDGEQPVVHEDEHRGRPSMEVCLELQKDREALFCHLIQHNAVIGSACNKIVNKRLFSNGTLRFREGVTAEDIDWTARLMSSAHSWVCCNAYFYAYRQRGGSISHSFSLESARQQISNIEHIVLLNDGSASMRAYLGVCVSNLLINVAQLRFSQQRDVYSSLKQLLPYTNTLATRRVMLISWALRLTGYYVTLLMLRIVQVGLGFIRRDHTAVRSLLA